MFFSWSKRTDSLPQNNWQNYFFVYPHPPGLRAGWSGIRIPAGALSLPPCPDRLWDPASLSNGYQGLFPWA